MSSYKKAYSIKKYEGLNCYYACVLNQVAYIRGSVDLAFASAYHLAYRPEMGRMLGDRITCEPIHLMRNIRDIYRISFTRENGWRPDEWGKQPVILELSSYHCAWLKEYHKVDRPHFIIFLGLSEGYILFADPSVSTDALREDVGKIEAAFRSLHKETNCLYDERNIHRDELLCRSIAYVNTYDFSRQLTAIQEHIQRMSDWKEEFSRMTISPFSSVLNVNLHMIAVSRLLYSLFIKDAGSVLVSYPRILQTVSMLQHESDQWDIFRMMMYRSFVYGDYADKKIKILEQLEIIKDAGKGCVAAINELLQCLV